MNDEKQIVPYTTVKYVGMGEIVIYLVSDDELSMLERGDPSSTYLNLAIFFLSVGISFLVSLLVSEPRTQHTFVVMVVITVLSFMVGIVLTVFWLRTSGEVSKVVQRIRDRKVSPEAPSVIEDQDVRS
jgi:protein-S-isoprenylcysteine O-methyltransferase Ste14